jgi:hypothetical protein
MSVPGWLGLLIIYLGYLFLGAYLFHLAECPAEEAAARGLAEDGRRLAARLRGLQAAMGPQDGALLQEVKLANVQKLNWGAAGVGILDGARLGRRCGGGPGLPCGDQEGSSGGPGGSPGGPGGSSGDQLQQVGSAQLPIFLIHRGHHHR